MSWFVRPSTTVLTLDEGKTIVVRSRLNTGETHALYAAMRAAPNGDGRPRIDPTKIGPATVLAYLVDWSLTDDDGRPVVIREQPADLVRATLDALEPARFTQIAQAIDAHIAREDAGRAEEKKTPTTANE